MERYAGISIYEIDRQSAAKPQCAKDEHIVSPKESDPYCRKNRARLRRKIGPLTPKDKPKEMTEFQKVRHRKRRGELALVKLNRKKAEELSKTFGGKIQQAVQLWSKTQFTANAAKEIHEEVFGKSAPEWMGDAAWWLAAAGDNIPFPPVPAKGMLLVSLLHLPFNPYKVVKGTSKSLWKQFTGILGAIKKEVWVGKSPLVKRFRKEKRQEFLAEKKRVQQRAQRAASFSRFAAQDFRSLAEETKRKAFSIAHRLKGYDPDWVKAALTVLVHDSISRGETIDPEKMVEMITKTLDRFHGAT